MNRRGETQVQVAVINRGSIVLGSGDPMDSPLPGSEVVAVNVARELAAHGVLVTYYGTTHPDTMIPHVRFRPVEAIKTLRDKESLRLLWLRDYWLPDSIFTRFTEATHYLLTEDSVWDMSMLLREKAEVTSERLHGYVERFDTVVFASEWHLDNWRCGYRLPLRNARVIYNLASHVPWLNEPVTASTREIVHTAHPRKALAAVAAVARRLVPRGYRVTCSGDPTLYQDASCRVMHRDGQTSYIDHGSFSKFVAANCDVLTFRPPVASNGMAAFLDRFGVLLHPDYSEETGATTVIEGIRRGLVPVVSGFGVLPELIGEAGIVIPGLSWTDDFADRCAAAIALLTRDDLQKFADARAQRRCILDTEPIIAIWREVLKLDERKDGK